MDRVLLIENFIQEISMSIKTFPLILESEWNDIKIVVQILKLPYQATIEMQKIKYTLSDFYATWLNLTMNLDKKKEFQLAADIKTGMKKREKGLIDTPSVLSSVFLDPRYRIILTIEEKAKAINHLTALNRRLNSSFLIGPNGRY